MFKWMKKIIDDFRTSRKIRKIASDYYSGLFVKGGAAIISPAKDEKTREHIGTDGIWRPGADSVIDLIQEIRKQKEQHKD